VLRIIMSISGTDALRLAFVPGQFLGCLSQREISKTFPLVAPAGTMNWLE